MTAAENSSTVPMNGIVAVMEEREYEVIDHTMHSWVFRSKNPDTYGFTLPSTWKPIPVDMLRNALRSEPLDADEVIEQAFEKAAYYEALRRERERLDPTPKGITFEEAREEVQHRTHPTHSRGTEKNTGEYLITSMQPTKLIETMHSANRCCGEFGLLHL